MRKFIPTLITATSLSIAWATAALAADMPIKGVRYQAPFNWSRAYVGLHARYGWANTNASGFASSNLNGFIGGAQIGYNWQGASPLVLGVEADFQGSAQRRSDSGVLPVLRLTTIEQKLPWFGTVRGRIGYAVDRALIYAPGG